MRLGRESVILIAVPLFLLAGAFALLMPGDGRDAGAVRDVLTTGVAAESGVSPDAALSDADRRGTGDPTGVSDSAVGSPSGSPRAGALHPDQRPRGGRRGSSGDRSEYPRRDPFHGFVVGPGGKPVDDAIIVVNERRNVFSDRGSPFHTPVSEVVSVDANGEFEIQRREGHVYVIHVQAETYARESVNLYATRTHQVTLTSAATVAGKVTDLLTHAVLPGANVLLQMGVTSQPLTATTDERGGFRFTGVRAGDGYLEVSHPRYKPRRIQLNSITPGGMSYKAVGLALGGHLEGTVTVGSTEASLPPEVPVLVSAYDRFRMQSAGVVSASSGGDFSFDSLYPGGQYVLTATAPGYGAATATVNLPVSGTVPPVHLVLDDEWVFEGVVTDSFGAPLRNCRIDLLIPALTSEDPVSRDTDEFGRFQIEGMGAHAYRLIASHPDHALEEISPITRALHENGVQITLQTGGVVTADVTGPAGNPVMAALVRLSVHDSNGQLIGPRLFGYTTNRGTFRMDHVPFGNVTLRIFAAGYGPYGEQFLLSGEGAMVHRYITLLLE